MVVVQVHLWAGPEESKNEIPASAPAMVKDLLAVSGGVAGEGATGSMSSSFEDAIVAIKTARQLHRLIRGYCSALSVGSLGAVITLSSRSEPPVQIDGLLFQKQMPGAPGQVLIVGAVCESIGVIPGLQLQSVSERKVSLDSRGHAQEVLHLLPPAGPGEMIYEPIAREPIALGSAKGAEFMEAMDSGPAILDSGLATLPSTPSTDPGELTNGGGRSPDPPVERRFPIIWVAVGSVAAIAIVAAVFFLRPVSKTSTPLQGPTSADRTDVPTGPTPGSGPVDLPGGVHIDPPEPPERAPMSAQPSDKLARTAAKIAKDTKNTDVIRLKTTPAADEEVDEPKKEGPTKGVVLGLNQDEIRRTIEMADRDSGNGKYADAIRKYNYVLKSDPGNAAARAGLKRAIQNQDIR